MPAYQPIFIDTYAITTIQNVIDSLEHLSEQLKTEDMGQFLLFNNAYLIVTHEIQAGILEDYFDNPEFIEEFIVQFARYFFVAINNTSSESSDLSTPWAKLTTYAAIPRAPIFISLMLGANAHINNDLPQVLEKMMPGDDPKAMLEDIVKLDHILMKSGKQIIGIFEENSPFLNFLKNHLRFTYYRPAMYTILYWRVRAWRSYERLKDDAGAMPSITARSVKIANRILTVARIISRW
jgi:hypothetical protein